jgi:TerC family integral membrane protein
MRSSLAVGRSSGGALEVPPYYYVGFIVFVLAMLALDLKLFQTDSEKEPSVKESGAWVAVWVGLAVIFGVILFIWQGGRTAQEYFAGYLIEYSLSVDNMFVFIVIFGYFKIPFKYQHQVLFYGILGALIFRGIFIALGTALVNNFEWIIYVFGAFLIFTAVRLARGGSEDIHPENNPVLGFARRRFPSTTKFDGHNLFTVENGKRLATPLFITLIFIEVTDILFALDSIPAIFGVTKQPFIVLTSNVFAILGLRSLYFLLAGALNRLHLLNYGLAFVLGFVGVKMLLEAVHVEIPIWLSLIVIVAALTTTTVLSLMLEPPKRQES